MSTARCELQNSVPTENEQVESPMKIPPVALLALLRFTSAADDDRPNLLYIMMDQLRFDVVGYAQKKLSHYENALLVETPNMDALAASGVVFEKAYCGARLCSGSGQCAHRLYSRSNGHRYQYHGERARL